MKKKKNESEDSIHIARQVYYAIKSNSWIQLCMDHPLVRVVCSVCTCMHACILIGTFS